MNESTIYKKLNTNFKPSFLKVENESHLHKNHPQSPKGGNSHFYVEIKSSIFNNLEMEEVSIALRFKATNQNEIAQRLITTENSNDLMIMLDNCPSGGRGHSGPCLQLLSSHTL